MDRLESAVARGKDAAGRMPDPTLPRTDDPANIRRAFEGLRNRIPAPDMEARARAAQARGQASLAAERERQAKAQIGSASCRARVCQYVEISVDAVTLHKKNII